MNGALYGGVGGVGGLAAQVERWSACERTVVCVWLARRVPGRGLRLLQRAVDAALRRQPPPAAAERAANDAHALRQALQPPPHTDHDDDEVEKLQQLLDMVPLLRTDNEEAKDVYMSMVPALVQRCVDGPRRSAVAPDLCRQLLSYLLVHPALTHDDQRTLTQWLRYLESHMSGSMSTETLWPQRIEPSLLTENIWGTNNTFRRTIGKNVEFRGVADPLEASFTTDSQESFSKNGRDVEISVEGEKLNFEAAIAQPKQRSNSLTPPSSSLQPSSSAENLYEDSFVKPRSFSLSLELGQGLVGGGLRSLAGGGSETRLERRGWRPGMAAVPHWLKALRLHKYLWLFTNLTYDQMMAMDDKYLEKLGVTRGARHKLLVSIAALHERGAALQAAHAALQAAAASTGSSSTCTSSTSSSTTAVSTVRALETLRGVLLSPLAPDSPLPAALVAALETASAALCAEGGGGGTGTGVGAGVGAVRGADDEQLVDPLSLHCWLVERALHHESFTCARLQCALRRLRHRLPPSQFYRRVCSLPCARKHARPKWRSAGAPPPAARPPPPPPPVDYCSLDALCLQMTQHAID